MLLPLLSLGLVALVSAAPLSLLPRVTCYSGVYIIGARGSEEDPGFGSVQSVVTAVLAAIPDSGSVALDYPASVLDPLYPDSVTDGINAMNTLIDDYITNCGGKIALTGFSQGANVISSLLAGGLDKPTPISATNAAYISAIAIFGDPTFTHGQSFDAGTDTSTDGIFSRNGDSLALLNTYAAKIQSYCDVGDFYCASGLSTTAHSEEVPTWGSTGAQFIVSLSS